MCVRVCLCVCVCVSVCVPEVVCASQSQCLCILAKRLHTTVSSNGHVCFSERCGRNAVSQAMESTSWLVQRDSTHCTSGRSLLATWSRSCMVPKENFCWMWWSVYYFVSVLVFLPLCLSYHSPEEAQSTIRLPYNSETNIQLLWEQTDFDFVFCLIIFFPCVFLPTSVSVI